MLQALAQAAAGDDRAAMAPLERALRLAGPEGQVGVFVAAGPPLRRVLGVLAGRNRPAASCRDCSRS